MFIDKIRVYRFLAFLVIAISLTIYLLTHIKKPQGVNLPEKVTAPVQKIPRAQLQSKGQPESSENVNYLDTVQQDLLSQPDLKDGQLFKVLIKGYIYDPKSQPLKDARVSLEIAEVEDFEGTIVYTDENGFFEINGEFLKGRYTLTIQHLKYKNMRESIEINSNRDEVKYIMLEDYGR